MTINDFDRNIGRKVARSRSMIISPVIMPVVKDRVKLPGREKVALLSRVSRQALKVSADKSGVVLGMLMKDKRDVPLPFGNHYWSVSHKSRYVAAVVSEAIVGIDIEEIKHREASAFGYVASDAEWELGGGKSLQNFFRCWTAKETVLKALGVGIGGLKKCHITSVPDNDHITLDYKGRLFQVEQIVHENHIVSVLNNGHEVHWIFPAMAADKGL